MEQQLKYKQEGAAVSASGTESWMPQVERMKVDLQQVQEAYEQKETILQDQIETLKKQVKRKVSATTYYITSQRYEPRRKVTD